MRVFRAPGQNAYKTNDLGPFWGVEIVKIAKYQISAKFRNFALFAYLGEKVDFPGFQQNMRNLAIFAIPSPKNGPRSLRL